MGIQNVQQFEGFYTMLLYVTLHTIICTHKELLNNINNAELCHVTVLMFKPYRKKSSPGRWYSHYVPNIKLLLRSGENTVFGKSFNAVSPGVPRT